jgi:phospholipid-binding lipoprotein MlaA
MTKKRLIKKQASIFLLTLALGASGCATTRNDPRDPWEGWNRGVQKFNDKLDDYFMKPLAEGYQWITPAFVDRSISNFFNNIDDIGVTINDLLQFKLADGAMDAGRFIINSTVGLAGFFDVASKVDLPKHSEDFDQTLGKWGLPSGPYLVLPFFGPSSPRGAAGLVGDSAMNPISYANATAISSGLYGVRTLDVRADNLSASRIADQASIDRYEFIRNAYFQQRNYLVYDGNPPIDEQFEEEFDLDSEGQADEPDAENDDTP